MLKSFQYILFTLLITPQIINAENNDEMYEFANTFANCAAIFSAASELTTATGNPEVGKAYMGHSRGAFISSAFTLFGSNIMSWQNAQEYSKNIQSTKYTELVAKFSLLKENPEVMEGFNKELNQCVDLSPVQEEIVQEMRKFFYENAEMSN